jgi:hypothetical protein
MYTLINNKTTSTDCMSSQLTQILDDMMVMSSCHDVLSSRCHFLISQDGVYTIYGVDECAAREITSEEVSGYMSNRENQHTYIFSSSLCTHYSIKQTSHRGGWVVLTCSPIYCHNTRVWPMTMYMNIICKKEIYRNT